MRHTIITILLTLGLVMGLCAGFSGMHHRQHSRHKKFEAHVAELCVQAALAASHGNAETPQPHKH